MRLALPMLTLMLMAGCASYLPATIGPDLRSRDGARLQISGTPMFSDLGESLMYLCPLGHAAGGAGDCLDIIAPAALVSQVRRSAAQCVVVSGTFEAFEPDRVGIGYFRSEIGHVEVAHAISCNQR